MSDITREQFASAVAVAISSVQHLYREVDRLIVGLRDALAEEPNPLVPVRGTLGKGVRDQTRFVVRNEYGSLFGPLVADEEDVEEDDENLEEETEDAEDDETDGAARKRSPAEMAADQPLLAIRIAMYDPLKRETFEPKIEYAVMSDWAIGNATSTPPGKRFVLARNMLRRIPRALAASSDVAKGGRLPTRAAVKRVVGAKKGKDRRLSCRLRMGADTVPLYSLENAEELGRLAKRMKQMWTDVVIGS
jgi:hypothetical protein